MLQMLVLLFNMNGKKIIQQWQVVSVMCLSSGMQEEDIFGTY